MSGLVKPQTSKLKAQCRISRTYTLYLRHGNTAKVFLYPEKWTWNCERRMVYLSATHRFTLPEKLSTFHRIDEQERAGAEGSLS